MASSGQVTALLRAWHEGDSAALDGLIGLVYPVLHGLAAGLMRGERPNHTLQPTALVNEAFLRLVKARQMDWHDRVHFLAIASRLMRQALVDHARSRAYQKRGQGAAMVPLELANPAAPVTLDDVLAVNLALEGLEARDPRKAQVVELRFFGGLTVEETAGVLGISEESVNRDWRIAKAWLLQHITEGGDPRA